MNQIKIALVGNPNVGKSTVFNYLTGLNQQVGNWAGKTVERKAGTLLKNNLSIEIIDLPGTYSLTAYSKEEIVTREYIINEKPDAVIVVVDAANLERNLYLVLQILELTPKVVLGLNMMDLARSFGIEINSKEISNQLRIPVEEITAAKGKGISNLLSKAIDIAQGSIPSPVQVIYEEEIETRVKAMEKIFEGTLWEIRYPLRWLALKRLEQDEEIAKLWEKRDAKKSFRIQKKDCCDQGDPLTYKLKEVQILPGNELLQKFEVEGWSKEQFEMKLADGKYNFISKIIPKVRKQAVEQKSGWTERIDRWILSPVWGYPILFIVIALVFWASFIVSSPLGNLISQAMAWMGGTLADLLQYAGVSSQIQSLIRDGVFAGVGAVLAFVPQIAIFFVFFALLQESGYLARAAFLGDRFMQLIGLHGKSFFSLVSGYGCNVPGIMAARTLEDSKDRLITILINPLIPCVPRLGVMSAVVAAFFPGARGAVVMMSLLLISLLLVMFSALLLRSLVFKTEKSAFVMEMPPYHIPTLHNILWPTWLKTYAFLKRAWTYILAASIIVWGLSSFPQGVPMNLTWAGMLGKSLEFIGHPLGFDWRIMVAILFGFTAKETTLSTLGILFGVAADASQSIAQAMTSSMNSLNAYVFLVVYMLYIPCLATVVTTYKETASLRWTGFGVAFNLILSFIAGWLIYHGASWLIG